MDELQVTEEQIEQAVGAWDDDNFDKPVEVDEVAEETTEATEIDSDSGETEGEESEELETKSEEDTLENEPETFTLKHFDGDKEVTVEEMQQLAQKGLDYDRVKSQIQELREDKRLGIADEFQKLSDLYETDIEQLINDLYQNYDNVRAEKENVTPEAIRREREADDKIAMAEKKEKNVQSSNNETLKDFLEKYPDVKGESITKETWKKFKDGTPLIEAYEQQLSRDKVTSLEEQLAASREENKLLKQQKEVKKKTPVGSLENSGDGKKVPDYLAIWDD